MKMKKSRYISALMAGIGCLGLMLAGCNGSSVEAEVASSEISDLYEEPADGPSSAAELTEESVFEINTEDPKDSNLSESSALPSDHGESSAAAGSEDSALSDPGTKSLESDDERLRLIASLPGMKDEDTKDLLGGGEENWSADKSYYIGRIFSTSLYGTECQVNTTCGDDGTVESVSIWIENGSRDVTQEETGLWIGRISDHMGSEPSVPSAVSEGGSQNYRWTADGNAATLYLMKDILSVSFQPAVGELK